jgi:hypothetical protein
VRESNPHPDANSDTYTYPDSFRNPHANSHTISDSYSNPYADGDY